MREKISLATKSDGGNDKRTALKAELESIRGKQSSTKLSRGKKLDQLKAIQEGMQKKVVLLSSHTFVPFSDEIFADKRFASRPQ